MPQVQSWSVSPLSVWTGPSVLWSLLIYDSFWLERAPQIPISCRADAKTSFTGYKKNHSLKPTVLTSATFQRPPVQTAQLPPPPAVSGCPPAPHIARCRFWEAGPLKKAFGATPPPPPPPHVCPLSSLVFTLQANFSSSVSIYCPIGRCSFMSLWIQVLMRGSGVFTVSLCVSEELFEQRGPRF